MIYVQSSFIGIRFKEIQSMDAYVFFVINGTTAIIIHLEYNLIIMGTVHYYPFTFCDNITSSQHH